MLNGAGGSQTSRAANRVCKELPCFWEISCEDCKGLRARDNAWKSVAVSRGTSDPCSKKWKNIGDKCVRELRILQKRQKGDEEGLPPTCSWVYFPCC